ncbi:MAG: PASTA domain-containing protein [Bdellovibrionales bacterium]|nr:PASTA domain-containing protein [Bdellovibrionales bacterium]
MDRSHGISFREPAKKAVYRLVWIFSLLFALWFLLLGRAAYLQILPNKRLDQLQKKQYATTLEIHGRRGTIVDRNGKELAVSVGALGLFADPFLLDRPLWVARRLGSILNLPVKELQKKLRDKKKRFVWIKHYLQDKEIAKIRNLELRGLGLVPESRRVYPNNSLLSSSLGFVGLDNQGLEGLELQYNGILQGEFRKVILPRDAHGRPLLPESPILNAVKDGSQLQLTIDSEIQFILENELSQAVSQHQAHHGVGVVLEPQSGEVLALASAVGNGNKDFQKNRLLRNYVLTDSFEAGSVMKAFVIAGAIRSQQVKPYTKIDCEEGRFLVGGHWVREADSNHKFGQLSVAEILAYSSNVGTAKIAMKMGQDYLRQTLIDFGFGQKLGIDLPGESKGILQALPWPPHLLSNISFGHGIAVTPLQVAAAYAAFANGGMLRKPYIVKKIIGSNQEVVMEPPPIRRVMSEEDAATIRHMLRAATMEHATGVKARIPGFPVAGKTGTAQKVDLQNGGYKKGSYLASFVGFVPAHAPKFVIFITIDDPKDEYYASQVAAPVFARIAQYAVRQQGLAPVLLTDQGQVNAKKIKQDSTRPKEDSFVLQVKGTESLEKDLIVPNLKGLTLREVYRQLHNSSLEILPQGQGVVVASLPQAGSPRPKNKKIRVFLEPLK